jgi:hypothetical protein
MCSVNVIAYIDITSLRLANIIVATSGTAGAVTLKNHVKPVTGDREVTLNFSDDIWKKKSLIR